MWLLLILTIKFLTIFFAGSRVLSQLQDIETNNLPVPNNETNITGPGAGKVYTKDPVKLDSPVPPGLSLPQDFPPLAALSRPHPVARKLNQVATSNIKPAVPVFPSAKNHTTTNIAKNVSTNIVTLEKDFPEDSKDIVYMEPKSITNIEPTMDSSTAQSAGTGHVQASQHSSSASDSTIRPALVETGPTTKKPSKLTEKRQIPGKLDIAATKGTSKSKVDPNPIPSKMQKLPESSFTSSHVKDPADSQPATPTKITSQATQPTTRMDNPRTSRVAPTSKGDQEVRTAVATPPVPESATTVSTKPPSRRPSLTSVQGPGTPISERISDNASFTSTSISRANSPPPTKVGTAPVRQNTKAQQRRERQARAKEAEKSKAEEEPVKPIVEEPVQAPIIGRKKKAKKITTTRETADSTPAVTRPSSPTLQEEATEEKVPSLPATPVKDPKKRDMAQNEAESPATPDTPAPNVQNEQAKPLPTAASIYADLVKSGEIDPEVVDNIFKNMSRINYRSEVTAADYYYPPLPPLSDDQLRALDKGECLYVEVSDGRPVVVMPDGQILKHFTKKEAKHYIETRARVMKTPVCFRILTPADEDMLQLHYPPYTTGGILPGASSSSSDPPKPSTSPAGSDDSSGGDLNYLINRFLDEHHHPTPQQRALEEANSASHGHHHDYHGSRPALYGSGPDEMDWPHTLLSVEEAEEAMIKAKKEHEVNEKKLHALIKKNRRLLFGGGH